MIHGGIGNVTTHGVHLPQDILGPLGIGTGTQVFVLYYPNHYKENIDTCHDLMITQHPPRMWHSLGKLTVSLRNESGAFAHVAATIDAFDGRASILSCECIRTGHRHSTWSFTVNLEHFNDRLPDIERGRVDFTPAEIALCNSIRADVSSSIDQLVNLIKGECDKYLFKEQGQLFGGTDNESSHRAPVEGHRIFSLSFFHQYVVSEQSGSTPVRATCESGFIPFPAELIDTLTLRDVMSSLPSRAFVSLDTDESNIRIAIIDKSIQSQFKHAKIPYQRTGLSSTRGLLSQVSSDLSGLCNIWRILYRESKNTAELEAGVIELYARSDDWKSTQKRIHTLRVTCAEIEHDEIRVSPIRHIPIFISCKTSLIDVVRGICCQAGEQIGILPDDFVVVDEAVRPITQRVASELAGCSGVIQFFAGDSEENIQWLESETFACIVAKIPYVRLATAELQQEIRMARDTRIMPIDLAQLQSGAPAAVKQVREALQYLVEDIQKRRGDWRSWSTSA